MRFTPIIVLLLAIYAVPLFAFAQTPTLIPATLIATTTGQAQLLVTEESLTALSLNGDSFSDERRTTINDYSAVTAGTHCYPRSGGTSSWPSSGDWQNSNYFLKASTMQTGNTSGGSPACNVTGTYYFAFTSGGTEYYIAYYYNHVTNTFSIAPSGSQDLAIYDNPQEYATTFVSITVTGTSTITFDIDYYLDPDEIVATDPNRYPTSIGIKRSLVPSTTIYGDYVTIDPADTGSQDVSYSLDVSGFTDGTYDFFVDFSSQYSTITGIIPFQKTNMYKSITISGGQMVSSTDTEVYNTTSYNEITTYKACSITEIDGCIENSFTYLFVPQTAHLQNFFDFQEEIPNRYPFAWFSAVGNTMLEVQQEEESFPTVEINLPLVSSDFEIISEDVISSFYPDTTRELFKNIAAWAIWIMFFVMVFFEVGSLFGAINSSNGSVETESGSRISTRYKTFR